MQDGDEPCKLFVGGLSWDTTKETLYETFIKFGEITDCLVMMNPETQKSRGFGFVTYKDPSSVELSLASKPHIVDNRQVDAKMCNKKAAAANRSAGTQVTKQPRMDNKDKKVFIGGLPLNATEERCREYFSQYGNVTDVVIMYDAEKQRPRGFGFIGFDNEETVEKMCEIHFVSFDGKQVECKRAKARTGGQSSAPDNQNPNAWAVAAITQQYTNPKQNAYGPQQGYAGGYQDQNINSMGIDVNAYGYGGGAAQNFGVPPAGPAASYGAQGYGAGQPGYGGPPSYGVPGAGGPQGSYMGGPGQQAAQPSAVSYDYGAGGYDYGHMGQGYSQQQSNYGPDRSGYPPSQHQAYSPGYGGGSGGGSTGGYGGASADYSQAGGYGSVNGQHSYGSGHTGGAAPTGGNVGYHPYGR